jgi:hypothetical protein
VVEALEAMRQALGEALGQAGSGGAAQHLAGGYTMERERAVHRETVEGRAEPREAEPSDVELF